MLQSYKRTVLRIICNTILIRHVTLGQLDWITDLSKNCTQVGQQNLVRIDAILSAYACVPAHVPVAVE
jgi:hypothetical protein